MTAPPMLNQLNGWQRIGVVLSATWVLVVLGGLFVSVASGGPFVRAVKGETEIIRTDAVCSEPAPAREPGDKTYSLDEAYGCADGAMIRPASETVRTLTSDRAEIRWPLLVVALLVPVLAFWSLAYVCVWTTAWVAKGFRKPRG